MKAQFSERNETDENQYFLRENGYVVLPSLFERSFIEGILESVKTRLHQCAKELSCSYEEYLHAASRWSDPSPVTQGIEEMILQPLQSYLNPLRGECNLVKLNIISKTPFSPAVLPFHQDISYSPYNPYQFSAWLALTDVPLDSGPMEVIIGSHKAPIESAVDFWSPDYEDLSSPKKGIREKLSVKMGDIIVFDSRLWHGSGENKSSHERFALVTRWKEKNSVFSHIPTASLKPFGMWTCQTKTHEILQRGFDLLCGKTSIEYVDLLGKWIAYLETQSLPFLNNNSNTIQDLKRVRLLHLAYEKHNGGDAQGTLYVQLWRNLLNPLSLYLDETYGVPSD